MMKKITQFKVIGGLMVAILFLSACTSTSNDQANNSNISNSGNLLVISELNHDWGDIDIEGGNVSHRFTFKNDSSESLYLKGAQTSCMCTTAVYELSDDSISPKYGMHNNPTHWSGEVKPGEDFEVNVVFDPMAHGPDATGPIQRSVQLLTSDPGQPITELKVSGLVLSKEDFNAKN